MTTKAQGKMLNTPDHWGHANQNYNEALPHVYQDAYHQ